VLWPQAAWCCGEMLVVAVVVIIIIHLLEESIKRPIRGVNFPKCKVVQNLFFKIWGSVLLIFFFNFSQEKYQKMYFQKKYKKGMFQNLEEKHRGKHLPGTN
jgi:hypothetical protein